MPQLFFETLEPLGDHLVKDGGRFQFGLFGEGQPTPSPGVRIEARGTGPNDFRILRPRLTLPISDGAQIQMRSRVKSNVQTGNDFQGVGSQIRAFNSAEPVRQVDINAIDSNPLLWLKHSTPVEWRDITAVHRVPEGVGADQMTGELLILGQPGGFCDVSSIRLRTVHEFLETWFNGGTDTRVAPSTGDSSFGRVDFGPNYSLKLVPNQRIHVSFTASISTSSTRNGILNFLVLLRDENGDEDELRHRVQITEGGMPSGTPVQVDINKMIFTDRRYNQIRFRISYGFALSSGDTLSISNAQIDTLIGDVLRDSS